MTPLKLNLYFAFFSYGGNGGISMEHPSIRNWYARTLHAVKGDDRIGAIHSRDYSDTPITMTRNRAVQDARSVGADLLVMVDSDQHPDLYLGCPGVKPWWESSFEFVYDRFLAKKLTVIGAPYCGPPPLETPYVFRWCNWQNDYPGPDMRLEMYSREEAAAQAGIAECAALPTGLILYDLRVFDLLKPPYFYYEWTDDYHSEKASTEDVTNTRDIAMTGHATLGYSPIHVNWDAWAGHYKPKCVGRPTVLTIDQIGETYKGAVLRNQKAAEKMVHIRPGPALQMALAGKKRGEC